MNGVAILTESNFDAVVQANPKLFVHFGAPWSVWSQRLAPIWEDLALETSRMDLLIGKVDCMAQAELCRRVGIMSFPTMSLFITKNSGTQVLYYNGDREIQPLLNFLLSAQGETLDSQEDPVAVDYPDNHDEGEPESPSLDSRKDPVAVDYPDNNDDEVEGLLEPPPNIAGSKVDLNQESVSRMKEWCYEEQRLGFGTKNQHSQEQGEEWNNYREFFMTKEKRIAPACPSGESNPRGFYDSYFHPCEIRFHRAFPHTIDDASTSQYHLSSLCNEDNVFSIKNEVASSQNEHEGISDYVRQWPDECVGDFLRCYSVSKAKERQIFMPYFCSQAWAIPLDVTHVSVSCQEDKQAAIQSRKEENPSHVGLIIAIIVLVVCGCGWMMLGSAYVLVFLPYMRSMKKSRSDPDLKKLLDSETGKSETDESNIFAT